ncbi:hypothetical protein DW714_07290, partial [Streptococcus anginosus]
FQLEKVLDLMKKSNFNRQNNNYYLMKKSNFNRQNNNYYNDFLKCQIYVNALKNNEIEWRRYISKLTISESARLSIEERAKKLMQNY